MALPYRQGLIVLGMHRSGTSALAGAAVRLGLAGPRVDVPVADDNPSGFYEPHYAVIVNHRLLKAAGCAWNLCLHFYPEKLPGRLTPADKRDIFKTLHDEFGETTSFVFKDPRLCLTLPAWLPALQVNGAALRVFILARHPAEVMEIPPPPPGPANERNHGALAAPHAGSRARHPADTARRAAL